MQQIIRMFENHNIETVVRDGRVFAKSWFMLNGQPDYEWEDITDWSIEDANKFLGY